MDLRTFLMQSPDLSDIACAEGFAAHWKPMRVGKGAHASQQGHPERNEYVVLDGCLTSSICDQDGKEVCVGFFVGPCVVTPNIARTREGLSLVSIAATTDASLVRIDTDLLSDLMLSYSAHPALGERGPARRIGRKGRKRVVPRGSWRGRPTHMVPPSIPRL
jgi:CRP-like cAMP-binding protein